jgi:hypothetical protein
MVQMWCVMMTPGDLTQLGLIITQSKSATK